MMISLHVSPSVCKPISSSFYHCCPSVRVPPSYCSCISSFPIITIFSFYACALRSSVLPNLSTCSSLGPIYFIPFVSFCFSLFSILFLSRILSPISAASSDFLSTDVFLSFPDRDDEVSTASLQPLDPDGGGAAAVGTSLGYAVMM